MIRDTSLAAYRRLEKSGRRIPQWMTICHELRSSGGLTRSELEKTTGIRLSSVCGRVNELIREGVLADMDKRRCTVTGETTHVVVYLTEQDGPQLRLGL